MLKKIPIILLVCIIEMHAYSQNQNSQIKVGFIKHIPDSLSGEGEVYSYDSISLKREKYILATDYNYGVIRINNKNIYLKHIINKKTKPDSLIQLFSGNGYLIKIITKKTGTVDYTYTSKGTIEIKKGSMIKIIKVHCVGGD